MILVGPSFSVLIEGPFDPARVAGEWVTTTSQGGRDGGNLLNYGCALCFHY